jgi:hypothetical protein
MEGRQYPPTVIKKDEDLVVLIGDKHLTLRMVINNKTLEVKNLEYNCKK